MKAFPEQQIRELFEEYHKNMNFWNEGFGEDNYPEHLMDDAVERLRELWEQK